MNYVSFSKLKKKKKRKSVVEWVECCTLIAFEYEENGKGIIKCKNIENNKRENFLRIWKHLSNKKLANALASIHSEKTQKQKHKMMLIMKYITMYSFGRNNHWNTENRNVEATKIAMLTYIVHRNYGRLPNVSEINDEHDRIKSKMCMNLWATLKLLI